MATPIPPPITYLCNFETVFSSLLTWEDKCTVLAPVCADMQGFVNFFELFFCVLGGNVWLMVIIAVVLIYFIFTYICAVVDEYIGCSLDYIQEWLGLSEQFAGVTLLALANGAGDVVTAVVAGGGADGVSYNVGALFGAGLFVCTLVMGLTITAYSDLNLKNPDGTDKNIILDPMTIYRDMSFYIVATLFVIFCGVYGQLTWWTSVIMLGLYFLMVLVVYVQEKMEKAKKAEPATKVEPKEGMDQPLMIENGEEENNEELGTMQPGQNEDNGDSQIRTVNDDEVENKEEAKEEPALKKQKSIGWRKLQKKTSGIMFKMARLGVRHQPKYMEMKKERLHQRRVQKWKNFGNIVMSLIELPFEWLRKLTMPPCEVKYVEAGKEDEARDEDLEAVEDELEGEGEGGDADNYNHVFTLVWPILGVPILRSCLTLLWPWQGATWYTWVVFLVVDVLWIGLFLYLGNKDYKKPPKCFVLVAFVSMVSGFIWTYYVSGMLIDLLTFVGVITKLSATYLALTIIAVGNALPDALLTITLAKKGKALMGISGGYAGQLFGLLIGFGLAMLKKSLTSDEIIEFPLFTKWEDNLLDIIVIFTALIALVYTWLHCHIYKMNFNKSLATKLFIIYGVFFVVATVVAVKQAYF